MSSLFDPLRLRDVTLKNRIVVSPMCEYSAVDGLPNSWHLVHLGSRAVGGASLVFTEATAVEANGRISPADTGIYNEEQAAAWKPIVEFIHSQGSVPGIQLAHAGRKASTDAPWNGGRLVSPDKGGWTDVVSSTSEAFSAEAARPTQLDLNGIQAVVQQYRRATKLALEAGFKVVEIHAAHGYLLHQFLSPLVNDRKDQYGGSLSNRCRIVEEVICAVREVWPAGLPLFLRISAFDWAEGGWTVDESVALARRVQPLGVDLIDCSSGGAIPTAKIEVGPGYQVPFAAQIRAEAGVLTGAVGMITEPNQADEIVGSGKADVVLLAREMLRDPYWSRRAAKELGVEIERPRQYARAW